jgi:predicted phosphodiesterase
MPDLTDRQAEILESLPATVPELAESFSLTQSTIRDHLTNAQSRGADIVSDDGTWHAERDIDLSTTTGDKPDPSDLPSSFLSALRDNGLTYQEMQERYDWGQDKAKSVLDRMSQSGWCIEYETVDPQGTRRWYIPDKRDKRYEIGDGDGTYRFGLISDTHLGSTATHEDALHDFYDKMQARGVDIVLHAGDISDGWEVHRNHINHVHDSATGWNRLLEYCVQHYPQGDGVETLFISGNHDRKLWRREGIRFSEMLDNRRDDLHWLGDSMARLVFDSEHSFDLELIHPSGGQPYTLGYRAQTLYREQPTDIRPSMAAIGHLHGRMQAAAEGVESFYTGCWKDLTTYGKRKGHAAEIGGWDVEITISDGELDGMTTRWEKYPTDASQRGGELPNIQEVVSEGLSADASGTESLFE